LYGKGPDDQEPLILAIGNAPTALIKLAEMMEDKKIKPELIMGYR
jgi:precorrin-8X/cobalt-precorrin-8 methylmutase